jgi:hypothetical protein
MYSDDSGLDSRSIAFRVKDLMERNGVAKRAQSSELSRILGLSFSAASRKMKGQLPWTIEQLGDVAAHFGEPPSVLIETLSLEHANVSDASQHAIFVMESRELPCLVSIGKELGSGRHADLVALQEGDLWRIYSSERAPTGRQFTINLIAIRPGPEEVDKPVIAIVDDDVDSEVADTLCDYLAEKGFEATPYYDIPSFREATSRIDFDAFVLDWLINEETVESEIKSIRNSENPHAPIVLLTGQIDAGNVDEEDIARIIREFDVICLEKPVRAPVLAAELSRKLRAS